MSCYSAWHELVKAKHHAAGAADGYSIGYKKRGSMSKTAIIAPSKTSPYFSVTCNRTLLVLVFATVCIQRAAQLQPEKTEITAIVELHLSMLSTQSQFRWEMGGWKLQTQGQKLPPRHRRNPRAVRCVQFCICMIFTIRGTLWSLLDKLPD